MRITTLAFLLLCAGVWAPLAQGQAYTPPDGPIAPVDPERFVCTAWDDEPPPQVWETPALPPAVPLECHDPVCDGPDGPDCDALLEELTSESGFIVRPPRFPLGEDDDGGIRGPLRATLARLRPRLRPWLPPIFQNPCDHPTLSQCQDPSFLEGCGDPAWNACAATHGDALARAFGRGWLDTNESSEVRLADAAFPEVPAVLEGADLAAARVAVSAPSPEDFLHDPSSFRSWMQLHASLHRQGGGLLTWLARMNMRGLSVNGCFETVHERWWDSSGLALASAGLPARSVFDAAYAADGIGREQLCGDDSLRSLDDRDVFGRMFEREVPKNAFVEPFAWALALEGEGGRPLSQELQDFVTEHMPATAQRERPTWMWHALRSRALRTERRITDATLPRSPTHPCGAVRTHGYTDEELNQLYELQQRFLTLRESLRVIAIEPDELAPDRGAWLGSVMTEPAGSPSVAELQRRHRLAQYGFAIDGPITIDRNVEWELLDPERAAARVAMVRSISQELLTILQEADRWGCFETDRVTPCDWSPRLFADAVESRFLTEQEAAFDECEEHVYDATDFTARRPVPGDVTLGRLRYSSASPAHPVFVTNVAVSCSAAELDPEGSAGYCAGDDGGTFPSSNNHWWEDPSYATTATDISCPPRVLRRTFVARSKAHELAAAKAERTALLGTILDEAPELLREGRMELPSHQAGQSARFGNDFFAVEYDWGVEAGVSGFDSIQDPAPSQPSERENLCSDGDTLQLQANARARANVTILGNSHENVLELSATGIASRTAQHGETRAAVLGTTLWNAGPTSTVAFSENVRVPDDQLPPVYDGVFVVLGVPVRVRAGVTATLSVDGELQAGWTCGSGQRWPNAELTLSATPALEVRAWASAAAEGGLARAGVKGSLTLVDISLPVHSSMSTIVGSGTPVLMVDNHADLALASMRGRIALFAEAGVGPLSLSAEKTLVSIGGVHTRERIVEHQWSIPLADLQRVPWGVQLVPRSGP